jgi:DNA-binding response OmpR family regulator
VQQLSSPRDESGEGGRGHIASNDVYDDGCLRVEFNHYFVTCKGNYLDLTKTEFLLVARLVRNIERIVRFQELWDYAWPADKPLNLASLHVYMFKVRRKLLPCGLRIDNMINVGYSLSHGDCCDRANKSNVTRGAGAC